MLFDPKRLKSGRHLARLAADRAALRFVHGLQLLMDGELAKSDSTPKERILQHGKLEVFHYLPRKTDEFELGHETHELPANILPVPVLLIPPLMVRPYIYDLRPEHSMVRELRRAGLDVYLLDFGIPNQDDVEVRLDDYVLDYVPRAIKAVREHSGRDDISLAGYCMGGIFALLHVAAWDDSRVRNLVTIASPIDFSKMGLLTAVARIAHRQAPALIDRIGNIPGRLNSNALKMLAPIKRFTRYADLFVNLWNEEYVRGFESMNRWTNDFTAYPRDAFKQLVSDFMIENNMMSSLQFGERSADLLDVRCSVLSFAGTGDQIATIDAVKAIGNRIGSSDFSYHEVSGGHIGVVAGTRARDEVWSKMTAWLVPRSTRAS